MVSIIQIGLIAIAGIAAVSILVRLSDAVVENPLLSSLLGVDTSGQQTSDSQTSDKQQQQGTNQQSISDADAEILRLEIEAAKAESEGSFNKAAELRALAEVRNKEKLIIQAENAQLELIIADKNSTTEGSLSKGDSTKPDPRKEASADTEEEIILDDFQTASGQTETRQAEETDVKGADITTVIQVKDDLLDSVVERLSNARTGETESEKRRRFFASGASETIEVARDTDRVITGGGASQKGTQAFIFKTKPKNVSDVLKEFPDISAGKARELLREQGTFQNIEAEMAFKEFNFGQNTGLGQTIPTVNRAGQPIRATPSGQLNTRERVSQRAREREASRAQKRLEAILNTRRIETGR